VSYVVAWQRGIALIESMAGGEIEWMDLYKIGTSWKWRLNAKNVEQLD
jgi:hypothetical protein